MDSFTCSACNVEFDSLDLLKSHHSSDWHRYNLKRKMHNLIAIPKDTFEARLGAARAKMKQQEIEDKTKFSGKCIICKKTFKTETQLNNHLQSKKHKQAEKKYNASKKNEEIDIEIVQTERTIVEPNEGDEEEEEVVPVHKPERIPIERCLFCSKVCENIEENLAHMHHEHSFHIPDTQFLEDLEGLITYLGEKEGLGLMCLYCEKTFRSLEAVQAHMCDVGHCKMRFDEEADLDEYASFYDYSEQQEIADLEELPTGEVRLPNGSVIGHKQFNHLYNKRAQPVDERQSVVTQLMLAYEDASVPTCTTLSVNRYVGLKKDRKNTVDGAKHRQYKDLDIGMKQNKLMKYFRIATLHSGVM
eukprot:TRINITY_DN782277_c0_g1_i1.p1 TRINITY_DN782277_c0_g1~~TRINITY_DN782277_c0_g1_i1.p1  ORF type:complete len:359 (-),score=101.84 TRINITY_DN782277_c0_g1_i1:323-1399(-)